MKRRHYKNRGHHPGGKRNHRPHRRRPFALRAVLFIVKLAMLVVLLPLLLMLMFFFAFALPTHTSGHVVSRLFDRILDWLVGPESQEIVISGKRHRGFLKF